MPCVGEIMGEFVVCETADGEHSRGLAGSIEGAARHAGEGWAHFAAGAEDEEVAAETARLWRSVDRSARSVRRRVG